MITPTLHSVTPIPHPHQLTLTNLHYTTPHALTPSLPHTPGIVVSIVPRRHRPVSSSLSLVVFNLFGYFMSLVLSGYLMQVWYFFYTISYTFYRFFNLYVTDFFYDVYFKFYFYFYFYSFLFFVFVSYFYLFVLIIIFFSFLSPVDIRIVCNM